MKAAIMVAFFLLSAAKPFSLVLGKGSTSLTLIALAAVVA